MGFAKFRCRGQLDPGGMNLVSMVGRIALVLDLHGCGLVLLRHRHRPDLRQCGGATLAGFHRVKATPQAIAPKRTDPAFAINGLQPDQPYPETVPALT